MKVLVTGAAGYIGSVTTETLLGAGYEVVALDNLEGGKRAAVHEDATFVQVDLRDRAALLEVFAVHRPDGFDRLRQHLQRFVVSQTAPVVGVHAGDFLVPLVESADFRGIAGAPGHGVRVSDHRARPAR